MGYTEDLTYGQTFTCSKPYGEPYNVDKLFDDNESTPHYILSPAETEWFQVQFSEAQAIAKLRYRAPAINLGRCVDRLILYGSNTGSFGGEETEILDSGAGLSWSVDEWKEWTGSNTTPFTYLRAVIYRKDLTWIIHRECEMMAITPITFSGSISPSSISANIELSGASVFADQSENITINDSIDAWHNAGYVTDDLTVSDLIDVESESQKGTSENLTISDFINGQKFTDTANNEFTIDDFMDFFIELDTPTDVNNIAISDSIDCLNWSEWLRNNGAISLKRFYFTLTGAADGETNIEIPISSFQARKRDGEATYLSVTIPGIAYSGQIADRSNGQMIIDMAYIVNGVEEIREEIIRVNLETIRVDEGARSRSISLTGHRSETFDGRVKDLSNPNYKYTINGKIRYRFATVDPYLNPGDTCRVGSDEFRVDYITYAISGNYRQMEVYEV